MSGTATSSSGGLSQKVVAGVGWTSLSAAGRQVLSLLCIGFLAHMLGPGAYGLMAMANVVMVFLLNFRDLGTASAIIQRQEISEKLLSSLFWVNIAFGFTLSAIVFVSAWPAAGFFHEPRVTPLLQALSASFLITSAGSVHNALLTRKMGFRGLAAADIFSSIGGYAVALTGAVMGLGVWSLVFANLANAIITTVSYWWFSKWMPSFSFDRQEVGSIAKFSLNLVGFGAVNYFNRNADNIVVGRYLGEVPLGHYQMAYNLMLYPIQNVSSVLGQVLLPAFSRIQEDDARFRSAYIRSSMLIGLITFPLMAGMAVLADPLVRAVLGEKWLPVIPLFRFLAPVGLLQSVQTGVGHIYVAKGRTDWMFRWGVISTIVFVAAFLIGVHYGVQGVAIAYAGTYLFLMMYPGFAIPFRIIGLSFAHFVRVLLPQIAITLAMAIICVGWIAGLTYFSYTRPWAILISTSLVGMCAYIALMVTFRPAVVLHLEEAMSSSRNRLPGRFLKAIGLFPGR